MSGLRGQLSHKTSRSIITTKHVASRKKCTDLAVTFDSTTAETNRAQACATQSKRTNGVTGYALEIAVEKMLVHNFNVHDVLRRSADESPKGVCVREHAFQIGAR